GRHLDRHHSEPRRARSGKGDTAPASRPGIGPSFGGVAGRGILASRRGFRGWSGPCLMEVREEGTMETMRMQLHPVLPVGLVLALVAPVTPARALAAAPAPSPAASSSPGSGPLEGWTRLRYTTSKLLVFSGELTMERTSSGDRTTVRTDSRATLLGASFVDSWSVSTMDRKSGRPLDFLDVRPKKKAERYT